MTGNELRRGSGSTLRWLILIHRYLGIPLSVLFLVWFASGIVMMYTRDMPRLTAELRLARLSELDLDRIALAPAAAAGRAHLSPTPRSALLLTVLDRPAYRFDGVTVFADTGERLDAVGPTAATAVASRFTGRSRDAVEYAGTLTEPDQWTLVERGELPLHRFVIDDEAGTELYVSPRTAEVVMLTTRRSRALAWIGAIPHWFYFTALRGNQPRWYDVVVWTSILGCLLAVIGLVLAVTQFRWRRSRGDIRSAGGLRARIPYAGWMRWHYLTGVVFGFVTLTWVFSGLLSMEPHPWAGVRGLELPRDALSGGPLELARFPAIDAGTWGRVSSGRPVKEIELLRIQDDPYYLVRMGPDDPAPTGAARPPRAGAGGGGNVDSRPILVAADTATVRKEPFAVESLLARLTASVPGEPVAESALLAEYDSYYLRARQLAGEAGAAAGAARQVRRFHGDVDLRRSRAGPGGRPRAPVHPRRAMALQRPAQPRLRVLVRPPAALGHRNDRAESRRPRVGRHRLLDRLRARPARARPPAGRPAET